MIQNKEKVESRIILGDMAKPVKWHPTNQNGDPRRDRRWYVRKGRNA